MLFNNKYYCFLLQEKRKQERSEQQRLKDKKFYEEQIVALKTVFYFVSCSKHLLLELNFFFFKLTHYCFTFNSIQKLTEHDAKIEENKKKVGNFSLSNNFDFDSISIFIITRFPFNKKYQSFILSNFENKFNLKTLFD